jgi:PIN domain
VRRIVLDTNVLRKDPFFSSYTYRLLMQEGREGRVRVFVPEVVFDEAVNLYGEAVAEQRRQIVQAVERLDRIRVSAPVEIGEDFVASAMGAYKKHLTAMIQAMDAEVVPYPDVKHEAVVRRALDRQRPFSPDGRVGYRDVLVWETVKALAREHGPLILITEDHAAFVERKDGNRLLPSLREELVDLGIREDTVTRLADVKSFTDEHVASEEPARLEVQHRLATEESFRAAILDAILDRLLSVSEDDLARLPPLPIADDADHVELWFDEITELTVDSAQAREDGGALVELTVEVVLRAHFDLLAREAPGLLATGHSFYYRGEDSSVVSTEIWIALRLPVDAVYNERRLEPESIRLEDGRVLGWSPRSWD